MKTIRILASMTALSALLCGCATSGQKFSAMKASLPPIATDSGRIFLYRATAFGAAVQPKVKLDGQEIGKAVPMGFFYVDRPAGNYKISASTEVKRELSLTLDKCQERYVKLNVSWGFFVGHIYPELVENTAGEKEIANCHYIGK